MAFTSLKKLSAQSSGSASGVWGAGGTVGVDVNTGVIQPLDTIVAGISTFSVASSNVSLVFTAGGGADVSNCMFRFTGTLTASIVVSPAAGDATTYFNGFYYWENLTTGAFTITLTTSTGSVVLPQGRRGTLFLDSTNAPRIVGLVGSSTADPIPVGTAVLFPQASAPAGWTQVVTLNDYALRLVSGTGAGTGGATGFNTVFGASVNTGSYTLQVADIPSHTHDVKYTLDSNRFQGGGAGPPVDTLSSSGTSTGTAAAVATGGGGGHTHTLSMNVNYVNIIQATRN